MAVLRSSRFAQALTACVLGAGACGVAFALAGPTPHPPADPLHGLPPGIAEIKRIDCVDDEIADWSPTTTIEEISRSDRISCVAMKWVKSDGETSNELADRLAEHYESRGFAFSGTSVGDVRSYYGTRPECGTVLTIDSGATPLTAGAGGGDMLIPELLPSTSLVLGPAAADPIAGVADPAPADTAAPTNPAANQPPPTLVPPMPIDPNLTSDSFTTGPDQRPGIVVLSAKQTRAIAPRSAGDRCS